MNMFRHRMTLLCAAFHSSIYSLYRPLTPDNAAILNLHMISTQDRRTIVTYDAHTISNLRGLIYIQSAQFEAT